MSFTINQKVNLPQVNWDILKEYENHLSYSVEKLNNGNILLTRGRVWIEIDAKTGVVKFDQDFEEEAMKLLDDAIKDAIAATFGVDPAFFDDEITIDVDGIPVTIEVHGDQISIKADPHGEACKKALEKLKDIELLKGAKITVYGEAVDLEEEEKEDEQTKESIEEDGGEEEQVQEQE